MDAPGKIHPLVRQYRRRIDETPLFEFGERRALPRGLWVTGIWYGH
jgi:hypothetical protein